MRRTFPLIATIAAEVAAVFGGAPAAVADTAAPEPVAVTQPADSTPDVPASDPAPDAPGDPVEPDSGGLVASSPPVQYEAPTFTVRTGRVGDPAAIASSLDERSDGTAGPPTETTTQSTGEDAATTLTTPQHESSGPAPRSAPNEATTPSQAPTTDGSKSSDTPSSSSASTPAPVSPTAPNAVSMSSASSHVVLAGDNLWDIAASHLASATGREVAALSTAEIVRYWVRVCEENQAHLQSGDVSLIYAGEVVKLPAS